MTPRRELNEFLVAQRTRLSRDGLGLPPLNPRQRTQCLRREDVAVLAGISPYYYARFERGETNGASDAVLEAIAAALQLDGPNRERFLALLGAGGTVAARRHHTVAHLIPASVQRVLDSITSIPAYARNPRLDIVGFNPLGSAVFAALAERPSSDRNLARFVFLDPAARLLYTDWPAATQMVVERLRAAQQAEPDDALLTKLLEQLSQVPHFRHAWASAAPSAADDLNRTVELDHPVVGTLRVSTESLRIETADITVTLFLPADSAATARRLRTLAHRFAATGPRHLNAMSTSLDRGAQAT